ncbi:hypothetical protein JCM19235_1984 [Vibrio maritimus]|uniref:Uncharacterized protein n=1 Tax=Vibrio maritimus TaxID=990268 RepID=A0A090RTG4_9VIBR|nr:hypothetical protein JCM19235_1984 [Vibrio maritimus]
MVAPATGTEPANQEAEAPAKQEPSTTNSKDSEPKISSDKHPSEELNSKKPDNYLPEYNPDVRAPKKLNHPLQDSNDMTFMLGEDNKGYYLYGEGAIVEGAYKKFKSYVEFYAAKNIKLDRLMMHSPGGLVNEGLAIGSYIRKNGWTTDADKYMQCYSSCGFIYAGGVKKRIQAGAKVGYHRPYIPSIPDTEKFKRKVYQDYQPYWVSIDGDPKLYDKFMKNYGRDEMYILTTDNISQYMQVEQY